MWYFAYIISIICKNPYKIRFNYYKNKILLLSIWYFKFSKIKDIIESISIIILLVTEYCLNIYRRNGMIFYEKKHKETGKEYAYRVLKENIMSLELKPGELLSESDLSEKLSISRTPIREVIMKLKG